MSSVIKAVNNCNIIIYKIEKNEINLADLGIELSNELFTTPALFSQESEALDTRIKQYVTNQLNSGLGDEKLGSAEEEAIETLKARIQELDTSDIISAAMVDAVSAEAEQIYDEPETFVASTVGNDAMAQFFLSDLPDILNTSSEE